MKTYILNSGKALGVLALMGGTLAFNAPAFATSAQVEIVTTTIDARDLKTHHGVERIYNTLENRAESACTTPGHKPLNVRQAEVSCKQNLLMSFVQNVDDERLTAYYVKMHS